MLPLNLGYNLLARCFKLNGPLTLHCQVIDGFLGELRRDIRRAARNPDGAFAHFVLNLLSEISDKRLKDKNKGWRRTANRYFNCCFKKIYARVCMVAACLLLAAPPWPPSMFSQYQTLCPCSSISAIILRAWRGERDHLELRW